MCQPGRPSPHGEPQNGSWGFAAFHSAKSLACRLSESTAGDKQSISGGNQNQHHSGHGTGGQSSRTSLLQVFPFPPCRPRPRPPDQSTPDACGPRPRRFFF